MVRLQLGYVGPLEEMNERLPQILQEMQFEGFVEIYAVFATRHLRCSVRLLLKEQYEESEKYTRGH